MSERPHWAVEVSTNGDQIVRIETACLSGREISEQDEEIIRNAAHHLLAFIGDFATPAPAKRFDDEEKR